MNTEEAWGNPVFNDQVRNDESEKRRHGKSYESVEVKVQRLLTLGWRPNQNKQLKLLESTSDTRPCCGLRRIRLSQVRKKFHMVPVLVCARVLG